MAEGTLAPDSGPVELLLDGAGQSTADSPHQSVFFANNQKGKILLDLGRAVRVQKINSYSWHTLLGVPVESRALKGLDSLLSIAQMPGGVPVATFAIGEAGAKNAALHAAAILGLSDLGLKRRLDAWRDKQTKSVAKKPK